MGWSLPETIAMHWQCSCALNFSLTSLRRFGELNGVHPRLWQQFWCFSWRRLGLPPVWCSVYFGIGDSDSENRIKIGPQISEISHSCSLTSWWCWCKNLVTKCGGRWTWRSFAFRCQVQLKQKSIDRWLMAVQQTLSTKTSFWQLSDTDKLLTVLIYQIQLNNCFQVNFFIFH